MSKHRHPQYQQSGSGQLAYLCGCCLLILILAGCQTTTVDKWKPVHSQHKNQVHTVVWEQETLPVIAKWYTGNDQNWKEIANANPNILPNQLSPGDRILIPTALVKTRAAMTKSFLEEWQLAEKRRATSAGVKTQGGPAPLLVPKLHKFKQDDGALKQQADAPPDLKEPEDDGTDLELFGPK